MKIVFTERRGTIWYEHVSLSYYEYWCPMYKLYHENSKMNELFVNVTKSFNRYGLRTLHRSDIEFYKKHSFNIITYFDDLSEDPEFVVHLF